MLSKPPVARVPCQPQTIMLVRRPIPHAEADNRKSSECLPVSGATARCSFPSRRSETPDAQTSTTGSGGPDCGALACTWPALPATAAPDTLDPAVLTQGWVTYPTTPVVEGVLKTVQGTREADGTCTLSLDLALPPNVAALEVHERAFNPDTCQSVIETSKPAPGADDAAPDALVEGAGWAAIHPTPDAPTARPSERSAEAEVPDVQLGVAAPGLAELADKMNSARYVNSKGYLKSYFEDPAQIDVNSVRNDTEWTWRTDAGACVSNAYGRYSYGWFTTSGWDKIDDNWQNYNDCYTHTVSSYAHYRNTKFCFTIDTNVYYDRNTVRGWYDGWLTGRADARKSGGCSALLSFHATLQRTQN